MIIVYKVILILKTYIYALLTLILPFYETVKDINELPFLNVYSNLISQGHATDQLSPIYKNHRSPNGILLFDYLDLIHFSKKMRDYAKTAEDFKHHFEEGLSKSFDFYQSSHIDQSKINDLIEANFYKNSSLQHQIERPQVTKINLQMTLSSLNQFSGEWHGNWKKMRVHHLWLPVKKSIKTISDDVKLMGFQSCFTGDGFGWNYVVKQSNHIIILGFVVHFDTDGKIISKNPHYGFLNNNNQLIWVTEDHIYNEFVCKNSNCSQNKHYIISSGTYKNQNGQLHFVDGFQTIYSSSDENLFAFKNINLKLSKL